MRFRCFGDLVRRAVGPDRFALWESLDGRGAILSGAEGQRLTTCTRFATLGEHARRLAGATAHGAFALSETQARAELEQRVADGLLIAEDELRLRLGSSPPAATLRIERLAVVTRERPEALARCVSSQRRQLAEQGREAAIVICHHDEAPSVAPDAEERHAGRAHREALAATLAARGVADPALLRWALAPEDRVSFVAGASRNALLLDAAGESLVMVDDDTVGSLSSTGEGDAIRIVSGHDPTERWYPDEGGELPPRRAASEGALSWHERLLGMPVATFAADADIEGLDGGLARRCRAGATVRTTQLGLAGDTGTGSLGHYLELTGASRARLMASEASYAQAWATRRLLRGVTQPTITDSGSVMSYALGLDLRAITAPFPPVLRNADGIFGRVMRACSSTYAAGFLPVAVTHEPPEGRPSSFEAFVASLERPLGNDLLGHLIAAVAPRAATDLGTALRQLGRALVAVAADAEFSLLLRERLARGRAGDVARLEGALLRHGHEPSWWAQGVRRTIMELERLAVADDPIVVDDLQGGETALRGHVDRYGRLLMIWPDVVEVATGLAPAGERLSNVAAP